ncbi:immunity 53 family protein [Promicromonospora sp. NPDC050249]|uniref:immunity 53 family protein n=1 Tax=Promicromonospora sp. NPDC050249 TaxID=3154743 RepID=UPI0033DCB427
MSELKALQEWYAQMSDGDWEHEFGISIETLDNPGWVVSIDLEGTPLDGHECDLDAEFADGEWIRMTSDGKKFKIACGPRSLDRAIRAFARFAGAGSESTAGAPTLVEEGS